MSPRPRTRHLVATSLALGLLLAACGGDDDDDAGAANGPATTETPATEASDAPATDATTVPEQGDEPVDVADGPVACTLLDPADVEALLGTPGVTAEPDTSLGAADGCAYAADPTDGPRVTLGYFADGPSYDEVVELACDGVEPVAVDAVGVPAVECYGTLTVDAGGAVLLVGHEDPSGSLDADEETALLAEIAALAVGAA
jgi:hypothetical protein